MVKLTDINLMVGVKIVPCQFFQPYGTFVISNLYCSLVKAPVMILDRNKGQVGKVDRLI